MEVYLKETEVSLDNGLLLSVVGCVGHSLEELMADILLRCTLLHADYPYGPVRDILQLSLMVANGDSTGWWHSVLQRT